MEITEYMNSNRVLVKAYELMDVITDIMNRNKTADPFLIKVHLSQLTRSANSIAANISECHPHLSSKHKISKLSIALGECYETYTHTRTLSNLEVITETERKLIINLCNEISSILNSALRTLNQKIITEKEKKRSRNKTSCQKLS